MHQYLCDHELHPGETVYLDRDQAHHALNVLHLDHEEIRLIYNGRAWYALGFKDGKDFAAEVLREDPRNNELPVHVTLCMALIRREKMELVLQKAAELGVSRIVPFVSSRCVVKEKKDRSERQVQRWQSILEEASNQCKRNRVPVLEPTVDIKDLGQYLGTDGFVGYENVFGEKPMLGEALQGNDTTVVIGPEGGFSVKEIEDLEAAGYRTVSFGSRILRAETAAIYALSVIGDDAERRQH
ncbi:MAG: 16S rRNA (uracil(1498)-N(3))-methyltransferase [Solobacterium sp.]|nr:16S rRNA (uracil(1498)-N(3))-methyltransferase [Solobacterium sp.]